MPGIGRCSLLYLYTSMSARARCAADNSTLMAPIRPTVGPVIFTRRRMSGCGSYLTWTPQSVMILVTVFSRILLHSSSSYRASRASGSAVASTTSWGVTRQSGREVGMRFLNATLEGVVPGIGRCSLLHIIHFYVGAGEVCRRQ